MSNKKQMNIEKNFIAICLSKFLVAFSNFVITYLTFFLVNYQGIDKSKAGLIVSLVALTYLPATLVGGKIKLVKTKQKMAVFFSLAGICYLLVPLINQIYIQVFLIMIGKFVITLTEPLIMAIINYNKESSSEKKEAFSTLYLVTNVGFALGPIIAGNVYQYGINFIFIIDGLLKMVISVVLILLYSEEDLVVNKKQSEKSGSSYIEIITEFPEMLTFSILVLVINWIYAQADFTLPILFNEVLPLNGVKMFSYAMSVNALIVILFTKAITKGTKEIKTINTILLSGVVFSIAYYGYTISGGVISLIAFTALWSVGEIMFFTNYTIAINEIVGTDKFGPAYALINTLTRIASILNPFVIGVLLKYVEVKQVIFLISCITIAVTLIFTVNKKLCFKVYEYDNE